MRPYRTQIMVREGNVSRLQSIIENFRAYGRKCRNFYRLTTMMT